MAKGTEWDTAAPIATVISVVRGSKCCSKGAGVLWPQRGLPRSGELGPTVGEEAERRRAPWAQPPVSGEKRAVPGLGGQGHWTCPCRAGEHTGWGSGDAERARGGRKRAMSMCWESGVRGPFSKHSLGVGKRAEMEG